MCEGVREQVGQMLDTGKSEKEITRAMVNIYGEQILAAPPKSGFNLSAYVLPFAFLLLGGVVLYGIISRWMPGLQGETTANMKLSTGKEDQDIKHRDRIENELQNLDL